MNVKSLMSDKLKNNMLDHYISILILVQYGAALFALWRKKKQTINATY